MRDTPFFVAGGALRADARSYVKRQADEELLKCAEAGEFAYVLTARQMGKSSLMNRTVQRLKEKTIHSVRIDLTSIGEVPVEEWYLGIITELQRQLGLSIDPEKWWQGSGLGSVQRFNNFLRDVVLEEIKEPVVIFVDEIDYTLNLEFSDDFFAAIRSLYNARDRDPALDRLTFILLGVAYPPDLIKDSARTPFNIGERVNLQDFERENAVVLEDGLETLLPDQGESIFDRIYHWTNGHPYLTQKLCQEVSKHEKVDWTNTRIDDLVNELFLLGKASNESNLKFVQEKILNDSSRRQLLGLYRKIYKRKKVGNKPQSIIQNQLKLSGLVKEQDEALVVHNEIYRHVFNLAWLKENTKFDWTPIVVTILALMTILSTSVIIFNFWIETQKDAAYTDFYQTNSPAERVEYLACIFNLRGILFANDYDNLARSMFYELPRNEQEALFTAHHAKPSDILAIVKGLYVNLADIEDTGSSNLLLKKMAYALERSYKSNSTDSPSEKILNNLKYYILGYDETTEIDNLKFEIMSWQEGRNAAKEGLDSNTPEKYPTAIAFYATAVTLNDENLATLYERARVFTRSSRYSDALRDLEKIMSIAGQVPTVTPAPMDTPTVSPTVTDTSLPSPTSTPTDLLVSSIPTEPSPTGIVRATSTSTSASTPTSTPSPSPTPSPDSFTTNFMSVGQIVNEARNLIINNPDLAGELMLSSGTYPNLDAFGLKLEVSELIIETSEMILPEDQIDVSVIISGLVDIAIKYEWESLEGRILQGPNSNTIIYEAPNIPGTDLVKLNVTVGNRSIERSTLINIEPAIASVPTPTLVALASTFDCTAVTKIPTAECDALVALYNSTDGVNWSTNANWQETDSPCEWHGVRCVENTVTQLRLNDNELNGPIPPEMSNLSSLEEIYFHNNQLLGPIPESLGDLSKLRMLTLHNNQLDGSIPTSLGSLSNLEALNLERNNLSGSIPSELGQLAKLTYLSLGSNKLSGSIPNSLGNLTELTELYLAVNELSGSIPTELSNLSKLNMLYLYRNQLTDSIPGELGNLLNLECLALNSNQLTGEIPGSLLQLTGLRGEGMCIGGIDGLDLGDNLLVASNPDLIAFLNEKDPDWAGIATTFDCTTVTEIPTDECDALVALYNNTDGPNWSNNDNWLETNSPCDWYGVTCEANSITELILSRNRLVGTVPIEMVTLRKLKVLDLVYNELNGSIPVELSQLSNLEDLRLAGNQLNGLIPPELGQLSNLLYLMIHENQLNGSIPSELGDLSNLQSLLLQRNQLEGAIPTELGNLTELTYLRLDANNLSGTIPPGLGNLTKLTTLFFNHNQLQADIPSTLAQLNKLVELDLGNNNLTATDSELLAFLNEKDPDWADTQTVIIGFDCTTVTETPTAECDGLVALYDSTDGSNWINNGDWLETDIPCDWYGITCDNGSITKIELSNNQLVGILPPELGSLSKLQELSLHNTPDSPNNQLSGPIPSTLGNLANLTILHLGSNELSGVIPHELGQLSQLEYLNLSGNQIEGTIPQELGDLTNLVVLRLHKNKLSGPIPDWLSKLSKLRVLYLFENEFTGGIPIAISALSNLEALVLNRNPLGGTIPTELTQLSKLRELNLSKNGLEGTIPTELGNLSDLYYLNLDGNRLTGTIPLRLGELPNLQFVHLANNELTGSIPPQLSQSISLTRLSLYDNQLSGPIPSELGSLINLTELHLSQNELSGTIPPELGNLTDLTKLSLQSNNLSGEIPVVLADLQNINSLQLWDNQLSGPIPSQLGHLSGLLYLGLHQNNLSGQIPPELGNLSILEQLFLNSNQLSGTIPIELGQLTKLESLNLLDNQLSGPIPPELGNLANLTSLVLDNNKLDGSIPSELGNLTKLETLDLGDNRLNGEIPLTLGNLQNLTGLFLNNSELSGEIPVDVACLAKLEKIYWSGTALAASDPTAVACLREKETDISATITARGKVKVRKGPNYVYEILGELQADDSIELIGRTVHTNHNYWWQVNMNGQIGWVHSPFVTPAGDHQNVPIDPEIPPLPPIDPTEPPYTFTDDFADGIDPSWENNGLWGRTSDGGIQALAGNCGYMVQGGIQLSNFSIDIDFAWPEFSSDIDNWLGIEFATKEPGVDDVQYYSLALWRTENSEIEIIFSIRHQSTNNSEEILKQPYSVTFQPGERIDPHIEVHAKSIKVYVNETIFVDGVFPDSHPDIIGPITLVSCASGPSTLYNFSMNQPPVSMDE